MNMAGGSAQYPRQAFLAERYRLPTVTSVDGEEDENERDSVLLGDAGNSSSNHSDEGYDSIKQNVNNTKDALPGSGGMEARSSDDFRNRPDNGAPRIDNFCDFRTQYEEIPHDQNGQLFRNKHSSSPITHGSTKNEMPTVTNINRRSRKESGVSDDYAPNEDGKSTSNGSISSLRISSDEDDEDNRSASRERQQKEPQTANSARLREEDGYYGTQQPTNVHPKAQISVDGDELSQAIGGQPVLNSVHPTHVPTPTELHLSDPVDPNPSSPSSKTGDRGGSKSNKDDRRQTIISSASDPCFFSKTPMYVSGPDRAPVHRPRPPVAKTSDEATPTANAGHTNITSAPTSVPSSNEKAGLNIHLPPPPTQHHQRYQHQQQQQQQQQQQRLKPPNPQQNAPLQESTHLFAPPSHQSGSYNNPSNYKPPTSPKTESPASEYAPSAPPTTTNTTKTLASAATAAGGEAAESSSQVSSVSSCYSLTDNIHKHTQDSRNLDFGYLKSAMKRSSEGEGHGGGRRLSLFNTVMRRVSIHRRDSTPTGRIATFLFGAEDTKDTHESEAKEETGEQLLQAHRARRAAHLRESLFLILSGLYGIVIIILGAVIPITEIFISDDIDSTFEGFYIYLYGVSVLFLMYVYGYLLRRNRLKTELLTRTLSRSLSWSKSWARNLTRADTAETRGKLRKRMISLDVSNTHTGTFYLRLGVLGFGIGAMIHSGLNFAGFLSVSGEACSKHLQAVKPLMHLMFTFFQLYFIFMNSKVCIHRYKKLARFGLVHMCATNICVWFRSIVVETKHVIHATEHGHGHGVGEGHGTGSGIGNSSHGHDVGEGHSNRNGIEHSSHGYNVSGVVPTGKKLLAEMTAVAHSDILNTTSLSDILNTKSPSDILNATPPSDILNTTSPLDILHHTPANTSVVAKDRCHWVNMMSSAVEAAGPYLYPCTIEYSLMCAGILYIMWRNVGQRPRRPKQSEVETDSEDGDDEDEQRSQRMSVDCTSSSRGLFLGILLMVGTIISIIAFYMMVHQEEWEESAILLTHLSGTFIYTVTLVALILAAVKMKTLAFHNEHEAGLEDILILISYTGLLGFIIFSLIAAILADHSTEATLTIVSNVIMLVQATVQTIFMLAGDRMSAATELQVRKKPGREFITFLLISNFSMWAINTFETQTPYHNPIQVKFYGPSAWAIFTHISVPLGIYFRFHSTVCFSNIWKNAWKKRKHI